MSKQTEPIESTKVYAFKWHEPAKAGQTVVRLRDGDGEPPLIVLHGGGGSIHAFAPLRDRFSTALWAIQVTPDTPLDSLDSQVNHYFKKIKEQQPLGPYRLAAFSASSLIVYALALRFEQNHDEIIQLSFIDHFPFVFLCPIIGLDPQVDDLDDTSTRRVFHTVSVNNLCAMTRRDGGGGVPKRLQLAYELTEAFHGRPPSEFSMLFWKTLEAFLNSILEHIGSMPLRVETGASTSTKSKGDILTNAFLAWMRQVKATPTIFVASYGMQGSVPSHLWDEWHDLGASRAIPRAKVVYLDAGHYDILSNEGLIEGLQEGYLSHTFRAKL